MSFDPYVHQTPPTRPDDIPEYLAQELRRIEATLGAIAQRHTITFIDATADASSAEVIVCDASAQALTVFLPASTASLGTRHTIAKSKGANKVLIKSQYTINGSHSATLSAVYQQVSLLCDGKEWLLK